MGANVSLYRSSESTIRPSVPQSVPNRLSCGPRKIETGHERHSCILTPWGAAATKDTSTLQTHGAVLESRSRAATEFPPYHGCTLRYCHVRHHNEDNLFLVDTLRSTTSFQTFIFCWRREVLKTQRVEQQRKSDCSR